LRGVFIKLKILILAIPFVAAGVAYYAWIYVPAHQIPTEVAYVLPVVATVVDTPAEVRLDVAQLRGGDLVYVIQRTKNWAHIRLADGKSGWLELKDLLDSRTYERGRAQILSMDKIPPQSAGHTTNEVNLRLDPSRESALLGILEPNQRVQIFRRQYLERAPKDAAASASASATAPDASATPGIREAWYLVRAGQQGGWVLGRFITLDIPPEISIYAEGMNIVGWLVLNTVSDNGHTVPQYLAVDRMGAPELDFNHIRVFTWGASEQHYVTAYSEGNINGFFPIVTGQTADKPYFRLRLVDKKGNKYQRVFEMTNTIVHSAGRVDGWESNAMPTAPVKAPRRHR
jgi:SH3-like domain-containing protein